MEAPEVQALRERVRLFLTSLRRRMTLGGAPAERLSQLRSLSDIRIRSFAVGRSRVTAADLCALLADPKTGRFDALAVEHDLIPAPHLGTALEPLGETMGFLVESCLALQVLGPAEMREAISEFVRKNGKPAGADPAPAAKAAPAGPAPPPPLPAAVEKLLGGVKGLWAVPAGLQKILDMLEIPDTPVDRVSGEIERDPPLAAELLRTANIIGGTAATSVKRTIVMAGYPALRRLVIPSALVARLTRPPPAAPFDPRAFWSHSLRVAHAALLVARAARLGDPEEHFLAGFLHDLGNLVVARLLPARFKILREAAAGGEAAVLGTDHAGIGACVAQRWKLSPALVESIRHHHDTPASLENMELPREAPVVAALCALSKDASRPGDWIPFLRLPEGRLAEIRLQAERLSEDSLRILGLEGP